MKRRHVGWAEDSKSVVVRDRCDDDPRFCLYQGPPSRPGEQTRLTWPPVGVSDGRFGVSPDGLTLAFIRASVSGASDLYTMPIGGAAASLA